MPPSQDDEKYQGEEFRFWDGYLCRIDPLNAFLEDKKNDLITNSKTNAVQRVKDIAELREKRAHIKTRLHQKPDVYDEFTTFGKASGADDRIKLGVRDCLTFDDEQRSLPKRPPQLKRAAHLEQSIAALERKVHYALPPDVNPANPFLMRRFRPSEEVKAQLSPRYIRNGGTPRRQVTDVGAYRKLGLDHTATILPSATRLVESARSAPKYEEQMMLGFLSARAAKQPLGQPPGGWKIKKFEKTSPRLGPF